MPGTRPGMTWRCWSELLEIGLAANAKTLRVAAEGFRALFAEQSCIVSRRFSVFGRPGSDLLFQALRLSIIGAGEFNGRVRDGIGFRLPANTTRSAKDGNRTRTQDRTVRRPCALDVSVHEASWNFTRAPPVKGQRMQHSIFSVLVSRIDAH